jgi:nifR3 family TIM-barrel protein
MSFWNTFNEPIIALAPMEDVTDTVFRRLLARWGRPDIMFTEFIHTDIVLGKRRWPGLTPRLQYTAEERPLVAQIWGNDPQAYARAAHRIRELGFDGIDINMGCPVRKIRKKGACSGLILQPALAAELIAAAKSAGLPVSVKTRIGYEKVATETWCGHLLEQGVAALTVHGRTALQESEGASDWTEIGRAAAIARAVSPSTAVLGNGDVTSRAEIAKLAEEFDLDGVMIGRGIFSDPFLFRSDGKQFDQTSREERITLLSEHLAAYEAHWAETRNFEIIKKFFKIYLSGDPVLEQLREELNETHDYESARTVIVRAAAGTSS